MLSRHRFCCYMCLPNALLLRACGCGLNILPTLLFITLAYIDYFYRLIPLTPIAQWIPPLTLNPYILGSNLGNRIFFFIFFYVVFCHYYYSGNSTLLSILRFSYFITPYDAQASSAFSALITLVLYSFPKLFWFISC